MRIREGDPLEIFTDRDGEVIFKKYSPIGELVSAATSYAESLFKSCGINVIICDKDAVIAAAGVPKKEFLEQKLSPRLEEIIEARQSYTASGESDKVHPTIISESHYISVACPIFAEGDVMGAAVSLHPSEGGFAAPDDAEIKLIQTAAAFLGKQLE
jgi:AbrB family transcriptional regulator (stage V sporulation protein T)